jgi:hypothetical protein
VSERPPLPTPAGPGRSLREANIHAGSRIFAQGYRAGVLEALDQVQARRSDDAELLVWIAEVRAKVEADSE